MKDNTGLNGALSPFVFPVNNTAGAPAGFADAACTSFARMRSLNTVSLIGVRLSASKLLTPTDKP